MSARKWATQWSARIPQVSLSEDRKLAIRESIRDHKQNDQPPLEGERLDRDDIIWLLESHEVRNSRREGEGGVDLRGSNLSWLDLSYLDLSLASCDDSFMPQADFTGSNLLMAAFIKSTLSGSTFAQCLAWGADFRHAHAHSVHFKTANLTNANFVGANLTGSNFAGANLSEARFDSRSVLTEVSLGDGVDEFVWLHNVQWGGANLSVVDWTGLTMTGEEYEARNTKDDTAPDAYVRAIRTTRQLSMALRTQGLSEEADYFAYRSHVLRRISLHRARLSARTSRVRGMGREVRRASSWLVSWFLWLVVGYGYRPVRALCVYFAVLVGFVILYLNVGQTPGDHLSWVGAAVLSVSSFHGRGFFPGLAVRNNYLALSDPRIVLAAVEAMIGLFVEISFIAAFTQRFLGR